MGQKKKQSIAESITFRSFKHMNIPYAYVDPSTNFLEGSKHGEQSYIKNFNSNFSIGHSDAENELDVVIGALKTREASFLALLKSRNLLLSEGGNGWYQIDLNHIEQPPEEEIVSLENLLTQEADKKKKEKKPNKKKLEDSIENELLTQARISIPSAIQKYFDNGLSAFPEWITPKQLFDHIKKEYREMIIGGKFEEIPVPLLKLVTNLIAWYELPQNAKARGTTERSLYAQLKKYRTWVNQTRKGKRSSVRQASADIETKSGKVNLQQMLNKVNQSVEGQAKQQLGNLVEKKIKKRLVSSLGKDNVKLTGSITIRIPELNMPKIDLKLENPNENNKSYSETDLLQAIQHNRGQLRSPKSDIVVHGNEGQNFGLSIKSTALHTKGKLPHKIALHHGTYISLIRFLSRYDLGMNLAQQLSDPGIMHAVLNMVRAEGEVTSPSLDIAASSLAYTFLGANEGQIFTDYGQAVQDAYNQVENSSNSVVALVDNSGSMRMISSFLEEIKDNLNKASVSVSFKAGSMKYITKNGALPHYTHDIIILENLVSMSDFSSIESLVYMFSQ